MGLVVDPLVLGHGQTEPEVRLSLSDGPSEKRVTTAGLAPQLEAQASDEEMDLRKDDFTPPELLGSIGPIAQDTNSSVQDVSPAVQDSSASVQDSQLSVQDSQLNVQDISPAVQDSKSSSPDSPPEVQDSSANVQDSSANVQDISPAVQDSSANVQDSKSSSPDSPPEVQDSKSSFQDGDLAVPGTHSAERGAHSSADMQERALLDEQRMDDPPSLRRGGQEVRERLLARARAARANSDTPSSPLSRPSAPPSRCGGLAELDGEVVPPTRPIDDELDRVGTPMSRAPLSPHHARRLPTGLSPTMIAVIGTLLGLATVASIVALAIHVAPQAALPQLAPPREEEKATASKAPPSEPQQAPAPTPKSRERQKIPGPWRIRDEKGKPGLRIVQGTVGRQAFLRVVQDKGVKKSQAYRLLKAFEGVLDLDRTRRSDQFVALVERGSGRLKAFEYIRAKDEVYQARENDQGYLRGTRLDLKVKHEQYRGAFVMNGGLDESARVGGFESGLRAVLATALRGHMDPDFGRGDRLRIIVQEVTVLGEFSHYAGVEALEFISANGKERKRIYYFKGSKERGYYDAKGRSPYEGGWRNPVPGAPITSPFGMRMHPVLKRKKLHAGTDFGAPTGTPVYASSFGTVSFRGWGAAAGNLIKIEHPGGIETGYFHLSRFEPDLKVGDKVKRMQVIGYVGSTGRSTGPHLHFSAKKDGKYFDPTTLNLDALRVVHKSERDAFRQAKAQYDAVLGAIPLPEPLHTQAPPVAANDTPTSQATGGAEPDSAPPSSPAPKPASRPSKPGSAIYLTDKELLEMQSNGDDGEVE